MATPTSTTPPAAPLPAVTQGITQVIGILSAVNVGIPVIVGTITSIIGIVKALRGTAPPLDAIIRDIETTVAANDAKGKAAIAALKASQAATPGA